MGIAFHRYAADDFYRGIHQAPGPDSGAPLHDLTVLMPEDVYTHPRYYDFGEEGYAEASRIFIAMRGKPDAQVKIYRAVPQGTTAINRGDWVTTVQEYARHHGLDATDPAKDMTVLTITARARDLYTNGDSFLEYGYWGPDVPHAEPAT